jgi:hypothetical protein
MTANYRGFVIYFKKLEFPDGHYLTSFVLRAIMPNLPYTDQRGGWKLTKLKPAGLYAYEEVRSSFHHNRIPPVTPLAGSGP